MAQHAVPASQNEVEIKFPSISLQAVYMKQTNQVVLKSTNIWTKMNKPGRFNFLLNVLETKSSSNTQCHNRDKKTSYIYIFALTDQSKVMIDRKV